MSAIFQLLVLFHLPQLSAYFHCHGLVGELASDAAALSGGQIAIRDNSCC